MDSPELKTCTKCGIPKPLSDFVHDKTRKEGIRNSCKACKNSYYTALNAKDPSKAQARRLKYISKDPERERERLRNYRKNNLEKCNNSKRIYAINNRDKILEQKRKYRINNREKINELNRNSKRMQIKLLKPKYVASIISELTGLSIPLIKGNLELIQSWTMQIQAKRLIKSLKSQSNEPESHSTNKSEGDLS